MRSRRAGVALLLAVAIAGCGSGGEKQPRLTAGQQKGLVAQLEAVRTSAAVGDLPGAESTLRSFRRSVARLQRAGALDASTARALRLGAQRTLSRVRSDLAPPAQPVAPPVTQTTPAPAPQPQPPAHGPGKKKGHKKDKKGRKKGKGHGKGDD